MGAFVFMRSSSHRESSIGQQLLHLRDGRQIQVARDRVLEARGGQREVERGLLFEPGEAAVQQPAAKASPVPIRSTMAVSEYVRVELKLLAAHQHGGHLVMIDAVLDAHRRSRVLQLRECTRRLAPPRPGSAVLVQRRAASGPGSGRAARSSAKPGPTGPPARAACGRDRRASSARASRGSCNRRRRTALALARPATARSAASAARAPAPA